MARGRAWKAGSLRYSSFCFFSASSGCALHASEQNNHWTSSMEKAQSPKQAPKPQRPQRPECQRPKPAEGRSKVKGTRLSQHPGRGIAASRRPACLGGERRAFHWLVAQRAGVINVAAGQGQIAGNCTSNLKSSPSRPSSRPPPWQRSERGYLENPDSLPALSNFCSLCLHAERKWSHTEARHLFHTGLYSYIFYP